MSDQVRSRSGQVRSGQVRSRPHQIRTMSGQVKSDQVRTKSGQGMFIMSDQGRSGLVRSDEVK